MKKKSFKQELKKLSTGITLIALVITIIVLLILAGVSIALLTGNNGILTKTNEAKVLTEKSAAKEKVEVEVLGSYGTDGNINLDKLNENLKNVDGLTAGLPISSLPATVVVDGYEVDIDGNGNVTIAEKEEIEIELPKYWETTNKANGQWYSYIDISNSNTRANVNEPKLIGNMTAIKYLENDNENQVGSKWANAVTQDGSMWVWIPRYAYKITEGYHTNSSTGGTIEVAFINTNNEFLNGESGTIITDPSKITYNTEGEQEQWLVHPAFTSNAENGGGFGELSGLWVGKFETTGSYDSNTGTGILSVKPANNILVNMTANQQYKFAQTGTFGETITTNSHMAKNSEWGAVLYLAQSKYGTNGQKIEKTVEYSIAGGTSDEKTIYTANKKQSTTHNAYGIYGLNGGSWERVASYVNYEDNTVLPTIGGTQEGDLYGKDEKERSTSTAYKTVYKPSGIDQEKTYELTEYIKGDAVWETSNSYLNSTGSWFVAHAGIPDTINPFFYRGGTSDETYAGVFFFNGSNGNSGTNGSFRLVLAIL